MALLLPAEQGRYIKVLYLILRGKVKFGFLFPVFSLPALEFLFLLFVFLLREDALLF